MSTLSRPIPRYQTTVSHSLRDAIQGFLDYSRSKNLSPRTIEFYGERLQSFEQYIGQASPGLPPGEVTPPLIRAYLIESCETCSAATANHNLNVLRNFYNFLVRDGFVDENPALRVEKLKQRKTVIETFSPEQIQAILNSCGKDFCGIRDRAIMLAFLDTGIRLQELANLRLHDVSFSEQVLLVLGKGNKERRVPFGLGVKKALNAYLLRRPEIPNQDLLFVTQYGDSAGKHCVQLLLKRRAEQARITSVRASAHTYRHTFAKSYLLNGGDVFSLQKILGHTTMEMVRNYVNLVNHEVQTLHARFSPVDRMQTGSAKVGRKRIR